MSSPRSGRDTVRGSSESALFRHSSTASSGSRDSMRKSSFVASPYAALVETEVGERTDEPLGLCRFLVMVLCRFLFPEKDMDFEISAVFMYLNLLMLALVVFVFPDLGYTSRIVGGFAGQALILAFVPTSYFFHMSQTWNYFIVLGSTGVIAIVTALLDSACLSLAANYPVEVQESMQLGIGVSTLIGSVYRVATKLAFPPSQVVESSAMYFYAGAGTLLVCIGCYYYLLSLPVTKRCVRETRGSLSESQMLLGQDVEEVDKRHVIKTIRGNGLLVMLMFSITLCLWPGLISAIPCYSNEKWTGDWWPLLLLLLFAVMDCVGRFVVKYRFWFTAYNIWVPIVLRSLLIPALLLTAKGIWFAHDAWTVIFTTILGFTNGYIGTLSLLFLIDLVEPHETAYAGTLASFFLNSGLVIGSSFGLAFAHLV